MPVSESRVCVIRYNAICADLFCFFQDSALFTLHSDLCARSARARRGSRAARRGCACGCRQLAGARPSRGADDTHPHAHGGHTPKARERERQRVAECAARDRVSVPPLSPLCSAVRCVRARSASLTIHARTRERERERERKRVVDTAIQVFTRTQRQFIELSPPSASKSQVPDERRLTSQITVRMHGHGEDDNVLGKSQWTPVGHAAQWRTCRRSSQGHLRALHRQQAKALLADEALLGEFVIGREAGRVRGLRRPAVRSLLLRTVANVCIKRRRASLISLGMCGTTRAAPQHY